MSVEARRLPPSMAAVATGFVTLFIVLVIATIVAVAAEDMPAAPELTDLPLAEAVEVVDSMSICTHQACDGVGVALIGSAGEGVAGRLASTWRAAGWDSLPCRDTGAMCFSDGDLRISMNVWADIDPLTVPKFVETIADRGIDEDRLVYVHYYRCGVILPCE
jgi:hypothetical protein